MRIGYAIAKDAAEARALPGALRELGAERVYVDEPQSGRTERDILLAEGGLRRGDVLILLARSHLGHGREIPRLEALIADMGATVDIPEKPEPTPRAPGPAARWPLSYEEERVGRHWWHGPFRRADALREIKAACGRDVSPTQLNKHIGVRSKPRAWIFEKPDTGQE